MTRYVKLLIVTVSFLTASRAMAAHLNKEALRDALGIPPLMADIKDASFPRSVHLLHYVLIEDVHALPEAQGKIAAILLYAHHHWGSREAYVEGAFGVVGPPPFPIFTAERGERTVNELLRRGMFSGGELAAALVSQSRAVNDIPFEVIGMENPALYEKQLEVFETLAGLKTVALKHLAGLPAWKKPEIERLRRLLELKLTPVEEEQLRNAPPPRITDPLLSQAIQQAEFYYHLTNLRSIQFVQRTSVRVGRGPCLIVMGGFHTRKMTQLWRARGESFIVITPRLASNRIPAHYEETILKSLETLRQFPPGSLYSSPMEFLRLSRAHRQQPVSTN